MSSFLKRIIALSLRRASGKDVLKCRLFTGRIIALGVGNLQRADSEAVLVETAEPIHCDTESGNASGQIQSYRSCNFMLLKIFLADP